jgi:hypothetical protein
MHKSAMKCNKTLGKWCKNKHGASKIIDTLEMYQSCVLSHQYHLTSSAVFVNATLVLTMEACHLLKSNCTLLLVRCFLFQC